MPAATPEADPQTARHLARNLVSLRHTRSLTQDGLARAAGEPRSSVASLEAMGGTPHLPGTREFFTCLAGKVTLMVAGERYELAAGDVLAFPGNLPHSYQNADALHAARGVSVVVLAKAGV
jgi:mannose-6-phosphate isomerase-like protein (cupin superfamily)